ncbi:hypothetical protein OIU85_002413 [Salix viminalis]|uniref:PARP-type domain-containing protein n=1 Tax=Salix viminalis TaxID=40686 RepID=A0A9Q0VQW2_SALVM|nr:hypothetical protein OIU85_002413 [Salix viminalis]
MPPSKAHIIAEYAKSNRSSCKTCSKAISAKALRLGLVSRDSRGFDMTKWHHLGCFSDKIDSTELIGGFDSLLSCDQEALKKLMEQVSNEDQDVENKREKVPRHFRQLYFLNGMMISVIQIKLLRFDFDGCLAKTSVKRVGADAWSIMFPSIPDKLLSLYNDGFKLVIFTNESNIDRWKNKRQVAVDSKIGRLNNFIKHVKVPIQVFIACGLWRNILTLASPLTWINPFMSVMQQGRPNDHSDADLKFAKVNGLKFHVPEDYFGV